MVSKFCQHWLLVLSSADFANIGPTVDSYLRWRRAKIGDFVKLIVSPQLLANYLTILDIKIIFSLLIHTEKSVCEHYSLSLYYGLSPYDTVPPLLMFGHVTYQGFPLLRSSHNLSITCLLLNNDHITPCCNLIG